MVRLNLSRGVKEVWRTALPESGITAAPVITKTRFYALNSSGKCIAGFRRNGKVEWSKSIGPYLLKGGGFFKNNVYIYDSSGIIYVLDQNGEIEKRLYGKNDMASNLLYFNNKILFTTKTGLFVVFSLE
jgi:hypothetical protein